MNYQLQLFDSTQAKVVSKETALTELRVLTWNIANPSFKRADDQFQYIVETKANVIILTEAKNSSGCSHLFNSLENGGFTVYFSKPLENNYAVIIAERGFDSYSKSLDASFLPERCGLIMLKTFLGDIGVLGMYVPSRGPAERRNVDKRQFQNQMIKLIKKIHSEKIAANLISGGDLNVIEPDHSPRYDFFGDWEYDFYNTFLEVGMVDAYKFLYPNSQEYSWFGRFNDGYRFDHLFISKNLY